MTATAAEATPARPRDVKIMRINPTPEEVEKMVKVNKTASGRDPFIELCFNRTDVEKEPIEMEVEKHLKRMANPNFMYYKAVDPSDPEGAMLGVSFWYIAEDPKKEDRLSPWGDYPTGANVECLEASFGQLNEWRYKHFMETGEPYAYLCMLSVSPETQRRGVGTALLRAGIEETERRGLQIYLDASPQGIGLYEKLGWKRVIKNTINLKDFGGEDIDSTIVGAIRAPGTN